MLRERLPHELARLVAQHGAAMALRAKAGGTERGVEMPENLDRVDMASHHQEQLVESNYSSFHSAKYTF